MAHPGEVIVNEGTGEWVRFEATDADALRFELRLAPQGRVGGVPHKHPVTERFTVQAGSIRCWLPSGRRDLGPGDSLELPAGVSHYILNPGDAEARATVEVRPPNDMDTFFETVFAIAAQRRFVALRGLPRLLHGALLADTYRVYGPLLPMALQQALVRPLAALARRRGYRATVNGPPPG
jgi:mannose-6-phosphate isomerase-like protein (cupin superfamily)